MQSYDTFARVIAVLALAISTQLLAQQNEPSSVVRATAVAELEQLSDALQAKALQNRAAVQALARRSALPLKRALPDNGLLELRRIDPERGPVFIITNNVGAADSTSTDELWPGGSLGLDLEGSGFEVGEWDGGAIDATHPDLAGRVTQVDGATEINNHGTHVAGTLMGAGTWLVPSARGMAPASELLAHDWFNDGAEMAAAAASGLLVSNHSYGIAAGWLYLGEPAPNTWWWIGGADPGDVEDPYFGYYDAEAQAWDQIAVNAPYYLIVKASGNDGLDIGPGPGEEYTVVDQNGDFLFTSTLPRNPDCTPLGYDCLPTHSVAKNILTVGAVNDVPGGYNPITGPGPVVLADFSSRGPTDDGRIKPDLVGNGVFLISTWPESPFYAVAAGTSMAAPNVTGSLLLLQEHYEDVNGTDQFMLASTLKALAIHTADEAGDHPGPDYWYGWGLLNSAKAAQTISEAGSSHLIIEDSLSDGATDTHFFIIQDANASLVATLVWADPPATPVALSLDAADLRLVNDLDLRVSVNAVSHEPWVLDPASPAAAATRGDNFRDNVEQVVVESQGSGLYSVTVTHKGNLQGGGPQDYSLIISERTAALGLPTVVLAEDFESGMPAGWSVFTDTERGNTNAGSTDWEIRTPIAADFRYDNLTGGSGQFAMVDNDVLYETYTGLQSPSVDLSDFDAVVLNFDSYFVLDSEETINVEVSTDGGANWVEVWSFLGFNPFATPYSLDLTASLAGEANARFRLWFDSEGLIQGDLWQVDNVVLEGYGGEVVTEFCHGTDVVIQSHSFSGNDDCVADNSLSMNTAVTVENGAVLTLSAPSIQLGPGFSVAIGGQLIASPPIPDPQ